MQVQSDLLQQALEDIRPYAQQHGGDIQFVSYDEDIVTLRLQGACQSCPFSFYTLKYGVEERLRAAVPSLKSITVIT